MEAASGDAVIYMDTDLQDPPEIIPTMLSHWRAGADVVHTVRTKRLGENPLKMWITRQAYKLIRFSSTIDLPLETGDFKLLSRRSVDQLLALPESDPYFRGLSVWIGGTQTFVPYEREARHAGRTTRGLFSRNPCKVFVAGITSFSFLPIYVLAFTALAGLGLAVLLAIAAALFGTSGTMAGHEEFLLAMMTFFWASTIGAIAVVGIYIVRTYKDVRGRPRYIVRQRIGF
jgi:dolichol-phosphate mannosyltransferase